MPYRKSKRWGNVKPLVGSVVDWGDPINDALQACWLFAENGGKLASDAASDAHLATLGAAGVTLGVPGNQGPAAQFDGSAGYMATPSWGFDYSLMWVSVWINQTSQPGGASARWTIFDTSNSGVSGCPSFETAGDGLHISGNIAMNVIIPGVLLFQGGGLGTAAFQPNTWTKLDYVIDMKGGTGNNIVRTFVNGETYANSTNSPGTQTFASSAQQKNIGRRSNGAQFFPGFIHNLRVYSRAPRSQEIQRLFWEPYAGIVTPRRRIISGSVGATAYSLPAAAGSFTLTGASAACTAGRKLTLSAGTYNLTGASATVKTARFLSLTHGTFTLTGSPAFFGRQFALALDAGSFVLTGTSASVHTNRKLAMSPGAFTLTGSAATLARGHVVSLGTGSYTLTGASATLKTARRLTLATGAFALTGFSATFTIPLVTTPSSHVLFWSVASTVCMWSKSEAILGWSFDVAERETLTLYKGRDALLHMRRRSGSNDPSSWSFRFVVYTLAGGYDSTPVLDSTIATSITFTVTDSLLGYVDIFVPNAVWASIARGRYLFEWYSIVGGVDTELTYGDLTLGPIP